MTVDEMVKKLERLSEKGLGNKKVMCFECNMEKEDEVWDITFYADAVHIE